MAHYVRVRHPFRIAAVVILPDHLHCLWTLPPGDSDFSIRWGLIKAESSRERGERGLCQRRFWEHLVRDEDDFTRHVDYIHWDPVKHACVRRVADWPHSSFHPYLRRGFYTADWGGENVATIATAGE